jgi:translation initiation factor 4A
LSLKEELLRGVYSVGFVKPSAIQEKGILPILKLKDTIGQAQSGTGKTATFAIGMLQIVDTTILTTQGLIVAPTRELALQIASIIAKLGEFMKVKVHSTVGGTSVRDDINMLKQGIHIVVGTPGRIKDMINKGHLKVGSIKLFVLDEADEMLNRGFREQIQEIFRTLPGNVQVALFSATMPQNILQITKQFMRDPIRILVKQEELTLEGIRQYYVGIEKEEWKFETLMDLYENLDINQCIIYCNTKKKSEWISQQMKTKDWTVSCIHGEMEQSERTLVMKEFRSNSTRTLISTDLLARGIDVQQVNLVINFDLPKNHENYIHRIGRSGRFGRKGNAINFVLPADINFIKELEQHYETQIQEMPEDLGEFFN